MERNSKKKKNEEEEWRRYWWIWKKKKREKEEKEHHHQQNKKTKKMCDQNKIKTSLHYLIIQMSHMRPSCEISTADPLSPLHCKVSFFFFFFFSLHEQCSFLTQASNSLLDSKQLLPCDERFPGVLVVEHGNRKPPHPLARNAPVWPQLQLLSHAMLWLAWHDLHLLQCCLRLKTTTVITTKIPATKVMENQFLN